MAIAKWWWHIIYPRGPSFVSLQVNADDLATKVISDPHLRALISRIKSAGKAVWEHINNNTHAHTHSLKCAYQQHFTLAWVSKHTQGRCVAHEELPRAYWISLTVRLSLWISSKDICTPWLLFHILRPSFMTRDGTVVFASVNYSL